MYKVIRILGVCEVIGTLGIYVYEGIRDIGYVRGYLYGVIGILGACMK